MNTPRSYRIGLSPPRPRKENVHSFVIFLLGCLPTLFHKVYVKLESDVHVLSMQSTRIQVWNDSRIWEKELNLHQMIKDHHKGLLLDADISLWTTPGTWEIHEFLPLQFFGCTVWSVCSALFQTKPVARLRVVELLYTWSNNSAAANSQTWFGRVQCSRQLCSMHHHLNTATVHVATLTPEWNVILLTFDKFYIFVKNVQDRFETYTFQKSMFRGGGGGGRGSMMNFEEDGFWEEDWGGGNTFV